MITREFWQGRRVFLTGHTGFKGSWLTLWLRELGAQVVGLALPPPTVPNLFTLAAVSQDVQSIESDIRDLVTLRRALRDARPEVVFHLAAQPLVRESYRDPVGTFATNVLGTVHLLEAVRETPGVLAVVVVTTDKCYENKEWPWAYREYEPMGGHDPYSSSKGCAELATSSYRRSFFGRESSPRIASARAGNVIGGGDYAADRLIPDLVRAISTQGTLEIRSPGAIRPWQHVLEPLSAYLQLAETLASSSGHLYAEGWNFGPRDEDSWSVRDVVEVMLRDWSPTGLTVHWGQPSPLHEAQWLKLDISKAAQKLGWRPRLPLATGIEWTREWYQAALAHQDMRALTLHQIRMFQSLAP